MKLLTIDPGLNIGWAMFKDGLVVWTETTLIEHLDQGVKKWLDFDADVVVIEFVLSITSSKLGEQLVGLDAKLKKLFPRAIYIRPGVWKPKMKAMPIHVKTHTKHERDAVAMGMWWLESERVKAQR